MTRRARARGRRADLNPAVRTVDPACRGSASTLLVDHEDNGVNHPPDVSAGAVPASLPETVSGPT